MAFALEKQAMHLAPLDQRRFQGDRGNNPRRIEDHWTEDALQLKQKQFDIDTFTADFGSLSLGQSGLPTVEDKPEQLHGYGHQQNHTPHVKSAHCQA